MKRTMLLFTIAAMMAACNSESNKTAEEQKKEPAVESKTERNKKVIRASMDAFSKADLDAMVKDAAPNYIEYGDETMPPVHSADSTKVMLKMLMNSFQNLKPENEVMVAEGDYVFYYADWTGVFKNDLMGIKATGKTIKYKDCDVFKFNEAGKITEHRSVQNLGALLLLQQSAK